MDKIFHASYFPVLEHGNTSFIGASYKITTRDMIDNSRVILIHKIENAPFIQCILDHGLAQYGCLVAIPKTGYQRLERSNDAIQTVMWKKTYLGESPKLRPIIFSTQDINHTFGPKDFVTEGWLGKTVNIPIGSRLACGEYFPLPFSIASILIIKEDANLNPTSLEIQSSNENGFNFIVNLGSELFLFIDNFQIENQQLYYNLHVHFVCRCFEILQKEYGNNELQYNNSRHWSQYFNLRMLSELLDQNGLPHWQDKDFTPDKIATDLFPIQLSGNNC